MRNLVRNVKITHQLWFVMALVLITFILIGYSYRNILILDWQSGKRLERLNKYQVLINDANIDLLQARRFEKDFLLTYDPRFLNMHREVLDTTHDKIDILEVAAPRTLDRENIAKLGDYMDAYEHGFATASGLIVKLGLGSAVKSGLLLNMNAKIDSIAKFMVQKNLGRLMRQFNELRKNEEKFRVEGKTRHLNNLINNFNKFYTLVKRTTIPQPTRRQLLQEIDRYKKILQEVPKMVAEMEKQRSAFVLAGNDAEPLFDLLLSQVDYLIAEANQEEAGKGARNVQMFITTMIAAGLWITVLLLLMRAVLTHSLRRLIGTVNLVQKGDIHARTHMNGSNELQFLGRVMDNMLDERNTATQKVETENEQLNNAIIQLLETTSRLSENDLTVKAEVTEDVTGPVADAINQMVEETVQVLKQINAVATDVQTVANTVKEQGDKVVAVADQERQMLEHTLLKLNESAQAVNEVSDLAQQCNDLADGATGATLKAVSTVSDTTDGMIAIRESISESEKRIKRLGERSQEITGIVDIINTIAERTHVLALNASMQAAAAGEAGRGFAVVADEVQRLAESSRNSTSQIATLVQSIQSETAEAMLTMNRTIDQVVAGSELAERAGNEMMQTRINTEKLAEAVHLIADSALQQADLANNLREEAEQIKGSTVITDKELKEQGTYTKNLVLFSRALSDTVSIFKLPAA